VKVLRVKFSRKPDIPQVFIKARIANIMAPTVVTGRTLKNASVTHLVAAAP
jgi:hypothetical protein